MNRSSDLPDHGLTSDGSLPVEVDNLFPRMREIASIIYEHGGATAKEIQAGIEDPLTVCGIRTLLVRMERRGIVRSRRSGRHSELIYLPAVVTPDVQHRALRRFVDRNFKGSTSSALQETLRLVRDQSARASHV